MLAICREYAVAVVEDNPYGLPLRSLDRDVVYLGSFSKTVVSDLRVGWALVPPAVRDRLVPAAESATLCPPSFTQMLVSRYLAAHDWRSQVKDVHRGLPRPPRRHAPRLGDLPPGRLSYCYPSPERITEGVRRLAGVLEAELDVLHTFGSSARLAVGRGPQAPSPHAA